MDLGEQKVTLALLRETRHLMDGLWMVDSVSGPVYYDDWLSLDLKNVSEEILWLHSVEVCRQLPIN